MIRAAVVGPKILLPGGRLRFERPIANATPASLALSGHCRRASLPSRRLVANERSSSAPGEAERRRPDGHCNRGQALPCRCGSSSATR
jgi:hypothetical protein